jgi:hypothetical protein
MLTDCCPALGTTPSALGTAQAVKRNTLAAISEFPGRDRDRRREAVGGAMLECIAAPGLAAIVTSPGGRIVHCRTDCGTVRDAVDRGVHNPQPQNTELVNDSRRRRLPQCVMLSSFAGDDSAKATRGCGRMDTTTNTQAGSSGSAGCVMVFMSEQTKLQRCRTIYRVSAESREVLVDEVERYLNATVVPTTTSSTTAGQTRSDDRMIRFLLETP